jgi:hypothetical protein
VLVNFPDARQDRPAEAEAFLASKGYLVRAVANYANLPDAIRESPSVWKSTQPRRGRAAGSRRDEFGAMTR